jgi:hypothetical protein
MGEIVASAYGNAGTVTLSAIAVTSQTGKIDTNGGQVSSFANIGNGGRVKLKADRSVAVGEINTYAGGLAGEAIVEAKFNRSQVKLSQNFHNENCCIAIRNAKFKIHRIICWYNHLVSCFERILRSRVIALILLVLSLKIQILLLSVLRY